ncbi:5462_t:CDS:2, partial [Acaulospora colombiana]
HSTVSVVRRDLRTNQIVAVAQYRLPFLDKEKIRFGDNGPWRPLKEVLYRKKGDYFGNAKSFMGSYGSVYRWKERDEKGVEPLVAYNRPIGCKSGSYLEVNDNSVLNSLDTIVATFLVMEKKRRNREEEDEILEGVAGG